MQLKVQGMTCEGCANAVRRSVARVAPDARVAIDLASGRVTVDGRADEAAVIAAIEKAGYDVAR